MSTSFVDSDGTTRFHGELFPGVPRLVQVPIHYTDLDPVTGDAPLYLLQANERLLAVWWNVTVAFDDTTAHSFQAYGPGGAAVQSSLSDQCTANVTSAATGDDGMMGPVTGEAGQGTTTGTFPFVRPSGGAAIMLTVGGNIPTGDGTRGTLIVNLLVVTEP